MSILYIDLKSAYNTICRNKLFNILNNLKIFNDKEFKFLQLLNDNIYFKC